MLVHQTGVHPWFTSFLGHLQSSLEFVGRHLRTVGCQDGRSKLQTLVVALVVVVPSNRTRLRSSLKSQLESQEEQVAVLE